MTAMRLDPSNAISDPNPSLILKKNSDFMSAVKRINDVMTLKVNVLTSIAFGAPAASAS